MRTKISTTIVGGIERSIQLSKVMGVIVPNRFRYRGLLEEVDKVERHQGTLMAIKLWKFYYNSLSRFAMKEEDNKIEKPPFFKRLDSKGYPKEIKFFMKVMESPHKDNIIRNRMILTAFRSYELVKIEPRPDLSSILNDSIGVDNYRHGIGPDFRNFISKFPFGKMVKEIFLNKIQEMRDKFPRIPFHYTVKRGIAGQSMSTTGSQVLYLDSFRDMKERLVKFSSFFFNEDLRNIIDSNIQFFKENNVEQMSLSRQSKLATFPGRLSFVPDKGGKTRTVAIGNYWIQNTLKPLHEIMFSTLRKLACDGTYDQISQSSRVAKATEEGPVWSYDLTTATDRLLLDIQIDVMAFLDKDIGDSWGEILKDINFEYKGKGIKYKVGQPMGLYTSWASLALTHHFIIQYCAFQTGSQRTFMKYAVLGDDVAIWDQLVAKEYEMFMSKIGVSISKAKSYIPKTENRPWKAEFAKRLYLNGDEISAISPTVLKEGFTNFWNYPELATFLARHGLSQIVEAPISRVVKILQIPPKHFEQLSCAICVSEILGGPHLNDDLPKTQLSQIVKESLTPVKLMEARLDELAYSLVSIIGFLKEAVTNEGEELEKLYGREGSHDNLSLRRMVETRMNAVTELLNRMNEYFINEMSKNLESNQGTDSSSQTQLYRDEIEYEDNILTKIKDIEYIPTVKLSELMKGVTLHKDKKQYRVAYLQRLVRKLLSKSP